MRKKVKAREEITHVTGIEIVREPACREGNRVVSLLGKGLLIFLIANGMIGCFASSFNLEYNALFVMGVLLFIDLYLGLIFYKTWTKNVGYIVIFIVFLVGLVSQARYLISGYYAILNIVFQKIGAMMDVGNVMDYSEYFNDRTQTITIFLIFFGLGMSTLLNALISNYLSFVRTLICTLPLATLGFYFGLLPNRSSAVMLLAGYMVIFIMKQGKHFDGKMLAQLLVVSVILGSAIMLLMGFIIPERKIAPPKQLSVVREATDDFVVRIVSGGILGLFNRYTGAGGMSGGKLGGVAIVSPDYETDLVVKVPKEDLGNIYLKGFVGVSYDKNQWVTSNQEEEINETIINVINRENNILAKKPWNIICNMEILNVGADPNYRYMPYYSIISKNDFINDNLHYFAGEVLKGTSAWNESYNVKFSPSSVGLSGDKTYTTDKVYEYIPDENYETISQFCDEAGLYQSKYLDWLIEDLAKYFQEHIPYSKRPGVQSQGEDFINYFLTKGRTGYCAHFASAATLIFRYLGYPARYVEGYVVPKESLQTAIKSAPDLAKTVEVEVDDSYAHAWVEVFDDDFGWVVVDVTPYSFETEEGASGFRGWGFFGDWLGQAGEKPISDKTGAKLSSKVNWERSRLVALILVGLILCGIGGRGIRFGLRLRKLEKSFSESNRARAILNNYRDLCKICRGMSKDFYLLVTQREQLNWITEQTQMDTSSLANILEHISYRGDSLSESEYVTAQKDLAEIRNFLAKRKEYRKARGREYRKLW